MDYTLNSSDILFPGDADIPKLTSPMYAKVPEGINWANQDLMDTFDDKSSRELAHIISLKKRIELSEKDENVREYEKNNFGPLKTCEQYSEEKKIYQILSSIYQPLDQQEIHEMLKEVFDLVQNDIQKNTHGYPPYFAEPFLSWKEEIWNDGNAIGSIRNISNFEPKLYHHYDTLEQISPTSKSVELNNQTNFLASIPIVPAKEKKPSSTLVSYLKKRNPRKSLRSFYNTTKKNIKAITLKLLHI